MPIRVITSIVCLAVLLGAPAPAAAYIGPGAGISVIGTAVAFVGAVVFTLVGFVWYPLKRLYAALSNASRKRDEQKASMP